MTPGKLATCCAQSSKFVKNLVIFDWTPSGLTFPRLRIDSKMTGRSVMGHMGAIFLEARPADPERLSLFCVAAKLGKGD